ILRLSFDDDRAERTAPAAQRRHENPAAASGRADELWPVEPQSACWNRVRVGLDSSRRGGVRRIGRSGQGQLARPAVVNPHGDPAGPEEVVDLGAERLERAADTETGGNP